MRRLVVMAVGVLIGMGSLGSVQAAQAPVPAQSVAAVKDVVDLLTKAKRDCVVVEHNAVFGGYVAALLIPGVKLTVVTARFKDTTSMAYKIYQKDCMGAYSDLSAAVDAMDRVIIDDIGANGLIAAPKADMPRDAITIDGKTTKFDGDSKVLKQQKVTPADFAKTFASADDTYTQLLRLLSAELKK